MSLVQLYMTVYTWRNRERSCREAQYTAMYTHMSVVQLYMPIYMWHDRQRSCRVAQYTIIYDCGLLCHSTCLLRRVHRLSCATIQYCCTYIEFVTIADVCWLIYRVRDNTASANGRCVLPEIYRVRENSRSVFTEIYRVRDNSWRVPMADSCAPSVGRCSIVTSSWQK